jgi:dolichol-phosphate mannosyltransferase
MLFLIAPVNNEGAVLATFVDEALAVLADNFPQARLVVVDDGSNDQGPEILSRGQQEGRLEWLRHERRQGVGQAFQTGLSSVLPRCRPDDLVSIIEADRSNDLQLLPPLVREIERGFDVAIGSRYMPGGDQVGFPWLRRTLSRGGNRLLEALLPETGVHDFTIFYRVYRAGVLQQLYRDYHGHPFTFNDFCANTEIAFKLTRRGARFTEVPHRYRYDQKASASKFRVVLSVVQHLRLIGRYLFFRRRLFSDTAH